MTVAKSHDLNSKTERGDITRQHIDYMAMCC